MTRKTTRKPAEQAEPKAENNVKLFEAHGPWWMITALIAERFPYKTAMGIVGSLVSLLAWWVKTR